MSVAGNEYINPKLLLNGIPRTIDIQPSMRATYANPQERERNNFVLNHLCPQAISDIVNRFSPALNQKERLRMAGVMFSNFKEGMQNCRFGSDEIEGLMYQAHANPSLSPEAQFGDDRFQWMGRALGHLSHYFVVGDYGRAAQAIEVIAYTSKQTPSEIVKLIEPILYSMKDLLPGDKGHEPLMEAFGKSLHIFIDPDGKIRDSQPDPTPSLEDLAEIRANQVSLTQQLLEINRLVTGYLLGNPEAARTIEDYYTQARQTEVTQLMENSLLQGADQHDLEMTTKAQFLGGFIGGFSSRPKDSLQAPSSSQPEVQAARNLGLIHGALAAAAFDLDRLSNLKNIILPAIAGREHKTVDELKNKYRHVFDFAASRFPKLREIRPEKLVF